ncbi:galectin-2 isoform X1 [Dipodomys spectabilis]|uniref:galectin-2 isoform X1 n=1 Tax=Dipodomys spectabilis TaxID=105255 RepID=UPI001C53D83C|nr:galectin-2 isoform X1 [Dipodomys spectabilis]
MPGTLELTNMDMKPGTTLKLKGRIASDASSRSFSLWSTVPLTCDPPPSFTINLGQDKNQLNLHFNPRFGESTIVCNSFSGGSWGPEQRDSNLCFSPGSEVKITVTFQKDEFKVTLPDGYQLTFPNRLGHDHVSYLGLDQLHLSSFKLD